MSEFLDEVDVILLRAYVKGYEDGVHDEALPEVWEVDTSEWLGAVEAARLVASPDTLIVEKVNGEWGEEVIEALAKGMHAHWQEDQQDPEYVWAKLPRLDQEFMEAQAEAALDALLAVQTGDTE